jgi:orotate phosphoribosyltransferase
MSSIAQLLLDTGAVILRPADPFTWASGWRSPIYCDNRLVLSYPAARKQVADALAATVKEHFPLAGAIAGVATAGIPQGALVAERLDLPFLYVRAKPKEHGRGNQVEGRIVTGQPVAFIEDLVSTGGSSISAVQALAAEGGTVAGLACVFTYGFAKATQAFAEANIPFVALSDYDALLTVARAQGRFSEADLASLAAWRQAPELWGR